MANKRKEPKPGSQWRGIPWESHVDDNTFKDMIFKAQKPRICDYNGNIGNAQLPMKQRAVNLLKLIKKQPGGKIMAHYLDKKVLDKLIKDEDVYIENGKSGYIRQSHSLAVATDYQPLVVEEVVEEEPKVIKKTIKWDKKKDQKLLMDVIMGTADQDLVDAVGKTKTKMRKITK